MKKDLSIGGIVGLLSGALIYFATNWLTKYLPSLLSGPPLVGIVFVGLLFIALAEMPLMVYALRKIVRGSSGWIAAATFGFFVSFAFVYAAVFIFATGDEALGNWLAALGLARFASGVLIR
ncbi:MAG: hypothetical protein HY327_04840 [Chloroflexi bacterium]|nr:hypothetical protein [Chloroflexota bacterium]